MPTRSDEIAYLTVRLYAGGDLGIEGNVADAALAVQMLGAASEAVRHKLVRERPLIVPPGYLDPTSDPRYPLVPMGDRVS